MTAASARRRPGLGTAGGGAGLAALPRRWMNRFGVVHDPRVVRVLWGLAWFGLLSVGLFVRWFMPLLLAAVAALAALQTARRVRSNGGAPNPLLAAAGAALVVGGSWISARWAGAALLLLVAASVALGRDIRTPFRPDRWRRYVDDGARTLLAAVPVAAACASVVIVQRVDDAAVGFFLVAVCVFDAGDYLVGAGDRRGKWLGPLAGIVGVLVWTYGMSRFEPPPFDARSTWLMGVLTALCCPLGQWMGSWLLPRARSVAPALRRVDSWLVGAPVFLAGVWLAL